MDTEQSAQIKGYSLESQFIRQDSQHKQDCHFCEGVNIIRCMMVSVVNKHNQQLDFYGGIIQKLVERNHCRPLLKYQETLRSIDDRQKLVKYYPSNPAHLEIKQLRQFYKFRKFVPLFSGINLARIVQSYYYERLKLYYNQIKRNLNLTVDPSSQTQFTNSQSYSTSKQSIKSKILDDLSANLKIEQTTGPTLQSYKTQSKALQELVKFLKANERLKYVPPLNFKSGWQKQKKTSKQIFRDIILDKEKNLKKDCGNSKSKILITFFSRDSSLKKECKKSILKNMKSQKLIKRKDTKFQPKQKQSIVIQKLQKLKDQILDKKQHRALKTSHESNQQKTTSNLRQQGGQKIKTSKQQEDQKIKVSNQRSLSGRKTPTRTFNKLKFTNDQPQRKNSERLLFQGTGLPCKGKNKQAVSQTNMKVRKSMSQTKTMKNADSKAKNKSPKVITSKQVQKYMNSKRVLFQKEQEKHEQKTKDKNQDSASCINGRKSLDLTKLKSFLVCKQDQMVLFARKQEALTHKYQKFIGDTSKRQVRTTNVSPANRYKQQSNQIYLQKNDNIVSIKRKKLEMLKRKIEAQKINRNKYLM